MQKGAQNILSIFLMIAGVFLGIRYLFPLFFPFLLGTGLAILAEPLTKILCRKLPRGLSAAVSVTAAFAILALTLVFLGALLVRQLRLLPDIVPTLEDTAAAGMNALSGWLQGLTDYAPGNLGRYLREDIAEFFSGSSALLEKAALWLLNFAGGVISHVPDSALSIGTALISSYMIAAKLPKIREISRNLLHKSRLEQAVAAFRRLRATLGGWLLAQLKLSGITWLILSAGFLILRIPYGPLWAVLVALVDAFPILGTGTVLIPWSLVCVVQGETARGIGILGIYAVVSVTRSVMEPRLVGKQLGLDPLITLFSLYAGYKIWGLAGMILAPMAAALAAQIIPRSGKM